MVGQDEALLATCQVGGSGSDGTAPTQAQTSTLASAFARQQAPSHIGPGSAAVLTCTVLAGCWVDMHSGTFNVCRFPCHVCRAATRVSSTNTTPLTSQPPGKIHRCTSWQGAHTFNSYSGCIHRVWLCQVMFANITMLYGLCQQLQA
jgi:hypothetical protein